MNKVKIVIDLNMHNDTSAVVFDILLNNHNNVKNFNRTNTDKSIVITCDATDDIVDAIIYLAKSDMLTDLYINDKKIHYYYVVFTQFDNKLKAKHILKH